MHVKHIRKTCLLAVLCAAAFACSLTNTTNINMPCYKPLNGWQSNVMNDNGKFPIVFHPIPGVEVQQIPCGRCIGCRLEYSRQWAIRCLHEKNTPPTIYDSDGNFVYKYQEESCFLTLTYNDENYPENGSISKREWQLFLKKFRKELAKQNIKIRFFMCGEYGDNFGRPHYHALIFGWHPPEGDLEAIDTSESGEVIYRSEMLTKIWGNGHVDVGQVTFESAAYVARYVTKKINGDQAEEHYLKPHALTGELHQVEPEFCLQSRRPGIGGEWFKLYKNDLRKGFITVRGIKMTPAKYYEYLFEKDNPERYEKYKEEKQRAAKAVPVEEKMNDRLIVKEKLKLKKSKQLNRKLQ